MGRGEGWSRRVLAGLGAGLVVLASACTSGGNDPDELCNGTAPAGAPCASSSTYVPLGTCDAVAAHLCGGSLLCDRSGICGARCGADGSCATPGTTCADGACVEACTPLPVDSCPHGYFCGQRFNRTTGLPVLECFWGGGDEWNDSSFTPRDVKTSETFICTGAYDCPRGQTCRAGAPEPCLPGQQCEPLGVDGGASCACAPGRPNVACEPWCRVGAADCPAGTTCAGFTRSVRANGVELGTCRTDCDPTGTCPGGKSCVVESAEERAVTDCLTTAPVAGSCAGPLDCPAGKGCRVHAAGISACEPYCRLPGGACPDGSTCTPLAPPLVLGGVTYGTCTTRCDLLSATSCGPGATCAPASDTPDGSAVTDCVPAGTGVGAAGCSGQWNACVPGAHCVAAGGSFACETYCRPDHAEDCPPQNTCAAITPALQIGGVAYGVCQDDCDLAKPDDVCGPSATCVPIVDGVNAPHTACVNNPCHTVVLGTDDSGDVFTDCQPASSIPLGAGCGQGCPGGATCQAGICVAWCEVGPNGHCPGGTTCKPMSPALVIRGVTYGTCL